ncbi:unnamed protein product [Adineta steineri]|uniref:Uncharacterized protein n=1 Tax=Adineta steineri TaxID=433720 RepID=A0A815KTI0_9BILA|nr:unnamed protein product [Adineta steineri]CAF3945680.1 unnamed protein product [Adineta steineri]
MLFRMNIILLTLIASIFAAKDSSKSARRTYLVKKDLFSLLKFSQFSILVPENHLVYRIKSYYTFGRKLEVIHVPTNQIVCRLQNKPSFIQKAINFTIHNSTSDEWIPGKIILTPSGFDSKFIIKWDGYSIAMTTKFGSLTTTFEYEYHSGILAKFKKRISSLVWRTKFDLQVFSNDLPDTIYFIGLAIKEQNTKSKG